MCNISTWVCNSSRECAVSAHRAATASHTCATSPWGCAPLSTCVQYQHGGVTAACASLSTAWAAALILQHTQLPRHQGRGRVSLSPPEGHIRAPPRPRSSRRRAAGTAPGWPWARSDSAAADGEGSTHHETHLRVLHSNAAIKSESVLLS